MKINELQVGDVCSITLVVKTATPKETRMRKPYLVVELLDGVDTIQGNYWDWNGKNIPQKNNIVDVRGQVTEWQGTKQINIKGMTLNTERNLSEFAPESGYNLIETYNDAYALMLDVYDDDLRSIALHALEDLHDDWMLIPGAKSVHHAFVGGTLVHSLDVAKIAREIAALVPYANEDLCVVGGMLHDIGKLKTYRMNGLVIDMTDEGMLYDHIAMGAEMLMQLAFEAIGVDSGTTINKIEVLKHIILSHHGSLEMGAVVPPLSVEAHIVYHADMISAVTEQINEMSKKTVKDSKWTGKIWGLANRPHLTTSYIERIMTTSAPVIKHQSSDVSFTEDDTPF